MAKSKKTPPDTDLVKILKTLATKKDLTRFATKADLKNFATQDQLLEVRKEVWEVKDGLQEVKEQIKFLPTKTDFYKAMDKVMNELKTVREEQGVLSDMKRQVDDHDDRLETVEEKLSIHLAV
ncbi:hypothetical protein COX59_00290 [Candidatus Beckwithbacteria bacterium CG_4_10_14_0_2_um_filter_47_25]|uniref:Uncharacterized protein n=3 Tax=Candidatus Beckwithiibacteriota TaxID=1752726 RepID=A0A1J4RPX8_9BACT|nr:MAG: hypothetical protein AUJ59_01420 [Candidatus Beckwithbacteria bacterium CG1_02_47_37]PIP52625.1 MAG: hypothetical protein COX09_00435 [Candidatus Beckwithbacteria bacterium CG23_combo_of_CG06-09_8_20_14_all_47_9]PJA23367.1 MAG: hypothetical protein COX59_00290 [Candidatus Beckwithbacteria bacterium CG_4_10_14_0_2_um_filter_47_25]